MLASTIITGFVAALGMVRAAPTEKRADAITDTTILQYALTLEHLEDNFYSTYLAKFSAKDFKKAKYPDWVRNRIMNIAEHEAQHVALLSGALGASATQACNYTFPVKTVSDFVGLATVIENVGVSAYLGAAKYITTPDYVTVAGSILTTEARHQAWFNSAVDKNAPFSGPEDTPLLFSPVYTIAAQFITSCPTTNPTLPVVAYPTLTYNAGKLTYANQAAGAYAILYSGLDSASFPIAADGSVTLPATQGFAYVLVSSQSNVTAVADSNILAGVAIINTPFNSKTSNPAPAF